MNKQQVEPLPYLVVQNKVGMEMFVFVIFVYENTGTGTFKTEFGEKI